MEHSTTSPKIGALMQALSKAQSQIIGAKEDSDNPYFKSKYADLSSVWSACRGPLSDNGLAVTQILDLMGEKPCIITMLGHSSGQWIRGCFPLPTTKGDAQSMGSAVTYMRRYALSAMVGVCPMDDDGERAMSGIREEKDNRGAEENFEKLVDRIGSSEDVMAYVSHLMEKTGKKEIDVIKCSLKAWDKFEAGFSKWIVSIQETDLHKESSA